MEETPKQGREAESQKWDWVEAEVWTGRMLTTLENGVKGGRLNAYFIKQGLSTMTIAHVAISQFCRGPHQLESRMREICTSGSEGGGAQTNERSLSLSFLNSLSQPCPAGACQLCLILAASGAIP